MKMLITLLVTSFMSLNAFAASSIETTIENSDYVVLRVLDDRYDPPFAAGNLWKMINGYDYRKVVNENDLQIDCVAFEDEMSNNIGDCLIKVNRKSLIKMNSSYLLKYSGQEASRLNKYFVDNAYVSIEHGKFFISSYNMRREFFLGVDETLVESKN